MVENILRPLGVGFEKGMFGCVSLAPFILECERERERERDPVSRPHPYPSLKKKSHFRVPPLNRCPRVIQDDCGVLPFLAHPRPDDTHVSYGRVVPASREDDEGYG